MVGNELEIMPGNGNNECLFNFTGYKLVTNWNISPDSDQIENVIKKTVETLN